ncbi:hypothetical protein GHT06_009259 [Daphnia sinensis]|uniref:La-related protein 7 n=1 Tax=Daphnia sinensis TaxID=1820382 RepID=A0AAD5L3R0_9CRUS|nr:hypothetical protein GHT06_009259 [Daphnia sinensis]
MEDIKDENLSLSKLTDKCDIVEVSEEVVVKDETLSGTAIKKGKIRKRKKGLHTAIRNQMEFYFSDANISKDRFMQTVIKDGPEVPLDVFMNFNKLRALTEDPKEIVKALKFSTILKLSEDETKVSRITPFRPKSQEEVDLCTLYVENLPPHATIEWITSIFSEYGVVAYVSLPKFKDASRIKGFAFVEFNDPESAAKAVNAYAASSAYSLLSEDPGQLCSIRSFNAENQDDKATENKENPKVETEEEHNNEPKAKKQKAEKDEPSTEELIPEKQTDQMIVEAETINKSEPTSIQKKRPQSQTFKDEVNQEKHNLSLQVMSKKEWKKLRNKYLDMQRKCVRQIRMNSRRQYMNENRFGSSIENPEPQTVEVKPEPCPEFEPGLIVKIILDEPISDAKRFKSQVKCQDGVTYVEAQDCAQVAYVRCTDDTAAQSLVKKNIWSQSEILQGEEERDYWKKIEENRLKKRDKSSRPKKSGAERARQKKESIIDADQPGYPTRAVQHKNLHIRFDEENDD